ncbi:MAG: prepilin-type N-terminal cleavage/methylation domain-containing protein [Acidobacteria bacterium]|jgi:prepilin-type N-terminal cleavage/methylation domain-containing protein|nr:MAG: prepilin-type N-terminal cleavage/methylation domain-containing protein [Acidobacteriota bacterium]
MKTVELTPRSEKGFTLVEVIIVSIILVILAAVAVPYVMRYYKDI